MLTIKKQAREACRFLRVLRDAAGPAPLLCACLFLAGCGPPGARALLDGKRLLEQRKYEEATARLRGAVTLLGNTNALAFTYLGLACQQAGHFAEAENAYRRALALDHDLAEVHYNLGCLWLAQNKLEQAKTELTGYSLRRGNSAEGWAMLGTAQLRSREWAAADRSFAEALKWAPQNPEILNNLGVVRLKRERPVEAAQLFERALKAQPDYSPAVLNLAILAQQNLGNRELALQKYRQYLGLKPAPENAETVRGVVHQLEQELAASATAIARVPRPPTNAPGPMAKAAPGETPRTVVPQKPSPAAVTTAGNAPKPETAVARATPPPSNAAGPAISNTAARTPKPEEPPPSPVEVVTLPAEPVYKTAHDLASDPEPAAGLSSIPAGSKPPAKVSAEPARRSLLQRINPINLFTRDAKTDPTDNPKPVETATVSSAKVPQAAAEPAAKSSPAVNYPRFSYLSPSRPAPGNRAEAERVFAQGLKAYETRRLPAAIQAYQRATNADPSYFDAYYNLGLAASEAGNAAVALTAYQMALALRPDSMDARYNFGLLLKQNDYPLDAANEFEKLLAKSPNDARAHLALGNLYAQQLAQPAKARQHYLKVLEADPRNPQAPAIRYWLTDNSK